MPASHARPLDTTTTTRLEETKMPASRASRQEQAQEKDPNHMTRLFGTQRGPSRLNKHQTKVLLSVTLIPTSATALTTQPRLPFTRPTQPHSTQAFTPSRTTSRRSLYESLDHLHASTYSFRRSCPLLLSMFCFCYPSYRDPNSSSSPIE